MYGENNTWVVIIYEDEETADKALHTLKSVEKHGMIDFEDTVIVRKDPDGKVHVENAVDRSTKVGAAGGSLIGLLVGFMFGGPIGMMLLGGLGGALVGKLTKSGVDKKFIQDVSDHLQPGNSALFMVIRAARVDVVLAGLREYPGTIFQTSLPPDLEDQLQKELDTHKNEQAE